MVNIWHLLTDAVPLSHCHLLVLVEKYAQAVYSQRASLWCENFICTIYCLFLLWPTRIFKRDFKPKPRSQPFSLQHRPNIITGLQLKTCTKLLDSKHYLLLNQFPLSSMLSRIPSATYSRVIVDGSRQKLRSRSDDKIQSTSRIFFLWF